MLADMELCTDDEVVPCSAGQFRDAAHSAVVMQCPRGQAFSTWPSVWRPTYDWWSIVTSYPWSRGVLWSSYPRFATCLRPRPWALEFVVACLTSLVAG